MTVIGELEYVQLVPKLRGVGQRLAADALGSVPLLRATARDLLAMPPAPTPSLWPVARALRAFARQLDEAASEIVREHGQLSDETIGELTRAAARYADEAMRLHDDVQARLAERTA